MLRWIRKLLNRHEDGTKHHYYNAGFIPNKTGGWTGDWLMRCDGCGREYVSGMTDEIDQR